MAASENRFAPELNEKEVIELLENATPGSIKKATNYGTSLVIYHLISNARSRNNC